MKRRDFAWLALPLAAACVDGMEPAGSSRSALSTAPPVLEDINPAEDVVEVHLTAQVAEVELVPGIVTEAWTYNGSVPGPMIQGNVGDTLIVHFKNELPEPTTVHWHGLEVPADMDGSNIAQGMVAPGDTFRYEFKLVNAATHWYHPHNHTNEQIERGLAGPLVIRDPHEQNLLDIPRSRDRTFVLDDALLDLDPSSDRFGQFEAFATESDYLDDHTPVERTTQIINGRETEDNVLLVNGRGVLDPHEDSRDLPTVYVRNGVPERWRFINTANGRFMRVSIPGHTLHQVGGDGGLFESPAERAPIEMIPDPHDPDHLMSNPDPGLGVFLSVSERADVVFTPQGEPGDVVYVEWHDYPRGRHGAVPHGAVMDDGSVCGEGMMDGDGPCLVHAHHDGRQHPKPILRMVFLDGEPATEPYTPPPHLRDLPDFREDVDLADLDQSLPVFFGHGPPMPSGHIPLFATVRDRDALLADVRAGRGRGSTEMMDMIMPPMYGPAPFKKVLADPQNLALHADVGDTRYWEIVNFTGGDHPFHAHGFFFQPIEIEYVDLMNPENSRVVPWPRLELKDSVRVPKRPGEMMMSYTIVRAATRIDDDHYPPELRRSEEDLVAHGGDPSVAPGGWLNHCHIDEHAASGMMTFLNVWPEP